MIIKRIMGEFGIITRNCRVNLKQAFKIQVRTAIPYDLISITHRRPLPVGAGIILDISSGGDAIGSIKITPETPADLGTLATGKICSCLKTLRNGEEVIMISLFRT